jgi:Spy/CpxP family protein refolding chaperone
MTTKWIKPIGAAVLAAGMTFAYAEAPAQPGNRPANRQQWIERRFDRISAYLNLTDAQKTQAQAVLKEAHESAAKLAPQMKANREALAAAIKANNKTEIDRLAARRGVLMGKMMAVRDEGFAKIYQTLTPEQRVKADQMREHFHAMRHERGEGQSHRQS